MPRAMALALASVRARQPMHGPNQWPDAGAFPGFRAGVLSYMASMGRLAQGIMGGVALCRTFLIIPLIAQMLLGRAVFGDLFLVPFLVGVRRRGAAVCWWGGLLFVGFWSFALSLVCGFFCFLSWIIVFCC